MFTQPIPSLLTKPAIGKAAVLLSAMATVAILWATNHVEPDYLVYEVKKVAQWGFLETHYLYLYILLFTISFPLTNSFEWRLRFYKKWKYLLPGNLAITAAFIAWDAYFTRLGVWGFNDTYLTGLRLLGLPWEEWMFFIMVPFSCVFIYESVLFYFKKDIFAKSEKGITLALMFLFFGVGLLKWEHIYTSTSFLLCGFFNLYHFLFVKNQSRGYFYLAYLFSFLPFLLVNGLLTGGFTENPVVVYNPDEFFGLRIVSIPVDDAAYGYLLLMANFSAYQYFKGRAAGAPPNQEPEIM